MTSKCKINGANIDMCESLQKATNQLIGDIACQVRTRIDTRTSRVAVVAGRTKKNKVYLNYCPFCGEHIETQFPEVANEKT